MVAHCLFEQSGTFKNEFKKLGIDAYDYDILNDFGQTDYVVDLFKAIDDEYQEHQGLTLFDKFKEDDIILAFFPCTRFENQAAMMFRGDQCQQKNWDNIKKLEYDLQLHNELHTLYEKITKLAIICHKRNLKLIIENPYSTQHYLQRYWAIRPQIIDTDRKRGGDYYTKPTQYWFINCEPKVNLLLDEAYFYNQEQKQICGAKRTSEGYVGKFKYGDKQTQVERSLIHPEYARRFIREYIL